MAATRGGLADHEAPALQIRVFDTHPDPRIRRVETVETRVEKPCAGDCRHMLIGTHGFPDETPDHQVDVLCHAGVTPENIPVDHAVGAKGPASGEFSSVAR